MPAASRSPSRASASSTERSLVSSCCETTDAVRVASSTSRVPLHVESAGATHPRRRLPRLRQGRAAASFSVRKCRATRDQPPRAQRGMRQRREPRHRARAVQGSARRRTDIPPHSSRAIKAAMIPQVHTIGSSLDRDDDGHSNGQAFPSQRRAGIRQGNWATRCLIRSNACARKPPGFGYQAAMPR